jgi:3-methyl-2-oxobutanoate hydroxymethyltransferase
MQILNQDIEFLEEDRSCSYFENKISDIRYKYIYSCSTSSYQNMLERGWRRFGTYINKDEALRNCIEVYKLTKAAAVKIEGGADKADIIEHLTSNSIAVMGHIGLMPQYVRSEGGYKVRGKTLEDEKQLIEDAIAVEKAGAFAIVVEGVKSNVAKKITEAVNIPIIGIGAGNVTDGQVLV